MRGTILVAALLLGACATRPLTVAGDAALVADAQVRETDASGRPLRSAEVPPTLDGRHDVLLLSGGGSDGAFGAGVLVGWTESGKRPKFDIVTGVSTGALMATLAFLGPRHDPDLRRLYTEITTKQVLKSRGVIGLLGGGGYFAATPLEKMIETTVDDRMLDEVAAEWRTGRRLYVATTDLDRGVTVTWDMGRIANSKSPYRATLYRNVLAASAAIPGVFRPSYLPAPQGTAMHVDGGVKTAVLFRSYMIDPDGEAQHVWTIVNGQIRWETDDGPAKANVDTVLPRTISEMLRTITWRSVYRVYVMARNGDAAYHLAYVPDDVPETNPIQFIPAEMARLFEAGRKIGLAGAWQAEPPRLERYERQR